MAFKPKIYESPAEKKKDFWMGVILFFALNILLTVCQWGVGLTLFSISPDLNDAGSISSALSSIVSIMVYIFPWLLNIGLVIYFSLTRSQIALGMIAGFGIALFITLCLGVLFAAWCFYAISSSGS